MTSDLEAALREAKAAIEIANGGAGRRTYPLYNDALDRIDAALDAASGEASGGSPGEAAADYAIAVFKEGYERNLREIQATRPAPSEAPNVERAKGLIGPAKKRRNARERAALEQYRRLRARISELEKERDDSRIREAKLFQQKIQLEKALDSARAEGIAAEKKRCADIAEWFEDHEDDSAVARCAGLIAEIISREAKP